MIHPTTPASIPTASDASADALREIGRGILASIDSSTPLHRSSPPEAQILTLCRFSLGSLIEAGRLEVRSRERVVLPSTPAIEVELDLLFRAKESGRAAVVEIEGWQYHRRSAEEQDEEIRRDRLIRLHYEPVVRYSAREVLSSPWNVLLDILSGIETEWSGFSLSVPSGMRSLAAACANAPDAGSTPVASAPEEGCVRAPLALLDHLRALTERLPAPAPIADPALQALRRDYPRAYVAWHPDEEQGLRDAFRSWVDVDDIAAALGRTPGAVWCQLRRMALVAG